jgi:alpha-amylase
MRILQSKLMFSLLVVAVLVVSSCNPARTVRKTVLPDHNTRTWSAQSNIYEVNLRQYSQSGSFKDFQKHLPRLKQMGVEILWFMPITPIGIEGRKMSPTDLGSYYAVRNYKAVNEEYGTMEDWKALVKDAHAQGFKVITDWVANHSAPDNPWIKSNPEFYERDKDGKMIAPFDWTDVRKLDYKNSVLRDSMIDAMKFWIRETGIDGYRCDVAAEVPIDFWRRCIAELKKEKDVFMLAEADNPDMHAAGFDATYGWYEFSIIAQMYSGKHNIDSLDKAIRYVDSAYPKDAYRMYFTTNHDENSWNGTEFERMGPGYKAFAVWTQTMAKSIPLVYSGQEVPNKRRLKFFTKDPIVWDKYELAPFYKTLLTLRRQTKALAADASFTKLTTGIDKQVYAFMREKQGDRVAVMLNLSSKPARFVITQGLVEGDAKNVFTGAKEKISNTKEFRLEPWGYVVYDY